MKTAGQIARENASEINRLVNGSFEKLVEFVLDKARDAEGGDAIHTRTIRKTHRDTDTTTDGFQTFDQEMQSHLNAERRDGYHLKKIEWAKEPQGDGLRMLVEAIVITERD